MNNLFVSPIIDDQDGLQQCSAPHNNMTSDGFTLVTRKSNLRSTRTFGNSCIAVQPEVPFRYCHQKVNMKSKNRKKGNNIIDRELCRDELNTIIEEKRSELLRSNFCDNVKMLIRNIYSFTNSISPNQQMNDCLPFKIDAITSYGIGSIAASRISQYQFAFLLILAELFDVSPNAISLFDPVFTSLDKELIQLYNAKILPENNKGQQRVTCPTLFYMPHCPKPLYNNLIVSNWSPLSNAGGDNGDIYKLSLQCHNTTYDDQNLNNVVIIGNSFESCYNRSTTSQLLKNFPVLLNFFPSSSWSSDQVGRTVPSIDPQKSQHSKRSSGIPSNLYPRYIYREKLLPEFADAIEVFNDTAIMWFKADPTFIIDPELNGDDNYENRIQLIDVGLELV